MNISLDKKDDLNGVITITLTPEDYQENVDKQLRNYRKNASLPGFRKGKVPMGMIKKMVGTQVLVEEINKVLSEALNKYIIENKLDVLGQPLPKENDKPIDWDNDKEFTFNYDVAFAPEFSVDVNSKTKFDKYVVKIDEKLIDKFVEDAARRYGKLEDAEKAAEEDMLFGKFEEIDENGNPVEGGITNESYLVISEVTDKKLQKKLIGAKKGDEIIIDDITTISKNHNDAAGALGITHDQLHDIKNKFKFTVENVKHLVPHELNQELFDKIYGEGQVKSVEEFRNRVKEELEKGLQADIDKKLYADIQNKLLEKLNLPLPDEFLKRWIVATNEKPITKEDLEREYPAYAKNLKWQLIENKIIRDNDIKVTHEEVVDFVKQILKQRYESMGLPVDDEMLNQAAGEVLKNREELENIYAKLYDDKLMELFKEKFKINEKEIDYDKFLELAYSGHKH
jgi:trigger factor